jgi:cell division protein FtsX
MTKRRYTRRDYTKIGALIGLLGVVVASLFGIHSLSGLDEAQKFFGYTLVLLFLIFVYFEYFKEYTEIESGKKT